MGNCQPKKAEVHGSPLEAPLEQLQVVVAHGSPVSSDDAATDVTYIALKNLNAENGLLGGDDMRQSYIQGVDSREYSPTMTEGTFSVNASPVNGDRCSPANTEQSAETYIASDRATGRDAKKFYVNDRPTGRGAKTFYVNDRPTGRGAVTFYINNNSDPDIYEGDEDDADDDEPPLPPSPGLPRRQSIEEYLSPTSCNNDKSGQGAATFYMDENDENNNILDYYNLLGENGRNDNAADPPLPPPPVSVPKQPQSPRTPRQTATSAVSSEKKSRPPSIEIGPWTNMLETTKGWPKARARGIEALVATKEFKTTKSRVASDTFKKIMAARASQKRGVQTPVRTRLGILRTSHEGAPQTTTV